LITRIRYFRHPLSPPWQPERVNPWALPIPGESVSISAGNREPNPNVACAAPAEGNDIMPEGHARRRWLFAPAAALIWLSAGAASAADPEAVARQVARSLDL